MSSNSVINDRVLLNQVLQQRQNEREAPIPEYLAFEIFACEQALKECDLSSDEIMSGVVGGGNDGGLDGIYVLLNRDLLSEDSEVLQPDYNKRSTQNKLELWLVQAKIEESFSEIAIEKVADSCKRLLDLGASEHDLLALYNPEVVKRFGFFRQALTALAARHPTVQIHFTYATKGDASAINSKIDIRKKDLEQQFSRVVNGSTGQVEFLGATELWKRSDQRSDYSISLRYKEIATSENSYVTLVSLSDYYEFITTDDDLKRHIFDWNIRDFQGSVEVNREIANSLSNEESPEFWWLNNGVTVLCTAATLMGKRIQLDNVQIVNGLQTSHTIFNVLKSLPQGHPAFDHSILVRIIVTDDPDTRDGIIRATNKQTTVSPGSLRATDPIQRKIETYFYGQQWFYDRRKNFYKNEGKNVERIVGIPFLAQAVMAMGLSRPDNSRARPSSLLKKDDEYHKMFSDKTPLEIYFWLAVAQKSVDSYLLSDASLTGAERNNFRFYVSMLAAAKLAGHRLYSPRQLGEIVNSEKSISDANLEGCLELVRGSFEKEVERTSDSQDKIAKGPDMAGKILKSARLS